MTDYFADVVGSNVQYVLSVGNSTVALEVVKIWTCTSLKETSSGSHWWPPFSSLSLGLIPLPTISSWFVIFSSHKMGSSPIDIHCIWMASWGKEGSWATGTWGSGFELI